MKKEFLLTTAIVLTFTSCGRVTDPVMSMKAPKYAQAMPSKSEETIQNSGSIYGQGYNPLFSDIKAMKVNDIVIVKIQERVESSSDRSKKLSKGGSLDLGGGIVQPAEDKTGNSAYTNTAITSLAKKINGLTGIGFNSNSKSEFSGKGQSTVKENFSTTVASTIKKVLSNGNYFISGSREIMVNGEKQILRVAGVIRPYDIDQDNTIDSQYISDAKIFYETEGDFKNTTDKGWGAKAVESVWPF